MFNNNKINIENNSLFNQKNDYKINYINNNDDEIQYMNNNIQINNNINSNRIIQEKNKINNNKRNLFEDLKEIRNKQRTKPVILDLDSL